MYRYWGKAQPEEEHGAQYHLLPYHSLDVAAVGHCMLGAHPTLLSHFASAFEMPKARVRDFLVFLLALHDLGKFSETFQAMRADLLQSLQGREIQRFDVMRHDSLGYLVWAKTLWPFLVTEGWFGVSQDPRIRRQWREVFAILIQTMVGHHGQPPKANSLAGGPLLLENHFASDDISAALEYVRSIAPLLLGSDQHEPLVNDPKALIGRLRRNSWWLAGFAVLCDWIGSNKSFFPYESQSMELARYWEERALPRAMHGLDETAVLPMPAAGFQSIHALFDYVSDPTPLQIEVAELRLQNGAQLFVLEDVMGSGKTEASMVLTQRLMGSGQADGAYVALPTMATANAMYERMALSYRSLFEPKARPSLVLAHSARELIERFRQSVLPIGSREQDYNTGEGSATAQCSAWLADQKKKALLANFGVGTIDQALLGVLYSRHQSLRLLGLMRKVLVVDEVHACDPYVNRLLRTLLSFHAAAGGSAVLMSATLPTEVRQGLVDSFCEGAGYTAPDLCCRRYPLLTQVGPMETVEKPLETRTLVKRDVMVEWLPAPNAAVEEIQRAVEAGSCVCWIRNTVADSFEAMQMLSGCIPSDRLHLFHARYAMCDRLAIEKQVLELFGKRSSAAQRTGQVLIATQVIEQSLDLDFDVLITDLAPIDLLLQRSGRLHRHRRDAHGNPRPDDRSVDARPPPRLIVVGPSPDGEIAANWYSAMFRGGARVYPDHGQLWLTARLLVDRRGFRMPDDARVLIEGVYGDDGQSLVPQALQATHLDAFGKALCDSSLARQNSLKLDEGYETPALDWWDDAVTPTRLGDPVCTIRLSRYQGDRIVPWAEGSFAWQRSEVSVRRAWAAEELKYDDATLRSQVETAKDSMTDKGKWSLLLILEPAQDHWIGKIKDQRGRERSVRYDRNSGLAFEEVVEVPK